MGQLTTVRRDGIALPCGHALGRNAGGSLGKPEVDVAVRGGGKEQQPIEAGLLHGLGVESSPLFPHLLPVPGLVNLLGEVWRLAVLAGGGDLVHKVGGRDDRDGRPEEVLDSLKIQLAS